MNAESSVVCLLQAYYYSAATYRYLAAVWELKLVYRELTLFVAFNKRDTLLKCERQYKPFDHGLI